MNIKRSAWLVAAFAMLTVCVYGAFAPEELVVAGLYDTITKYVAEDDVDVIPANVLIDSGGALNKTGGGLLTLPLEKLVQGKEITIGVRDGAMRVTAFDAETVGFNDPEDVLDKAALWLDAKADGTVLYTSSNDVDWVDCWLDVRETGNSTDGYQYLRALPNLGPANIAPQLVETNGVKSVWFGGYKSGQSMNWCSSDGSIFLMEGVRHAFILYGVYASHGFVLGYAKSGTDSSGTPTFHISNFGTGSPTSPIAMGYYTDTTAVYTGRTFVNGEMVDASKDGQLKQQQFQLLEYDCCSKLGRASNFFNDRNYYTPNPSYPSAGGNRIGGDYIAAAIIFTNELTEVERMSVETYLMNRHLGVRAPKAKLVLAEGTTALVEADALKDVLVTGDGTLMVDDRAADLLASPNFDFTGMFDVGFDTSFGLGNLFALKVFDGDRLTVEQTGYGLPTASILGTAGEGQVAKDGNGPALITTIPETVGTVSVNGGTLHLAAPPRKQNPIVPGSAVEVTFQNPNFENEGPTTNAEYKSAQMVAGWNLVGVKNGTHCAIFIGGDGTGTGWGSVNNPYKSPLPTPDNGMALMFKGDASAWTAVDIPADGIYDLSFYAAPRGGYGGQMLDICIGPSADNLVTVGTFTVNGSDSWRQFQVRTPALKAGTNQQFWFRNHAAGVDIATAVDCIKMKLVTDLPSGTIPVPNGSFELRGANFANSTLRTNNLATGWTLMQTNGWTSGTPTAAFTTPSMDSGIRFDYGHNRSGTVQLMLGYTGSKAETTFTPATGGVYRLKGLVANYRTVSLSHNATYVNASLVSGDTMKDLGTLTVSVKRLTELEWPNAVTVEAGQEVKLVLESRDAPAVGAFTLIDDLELVPLAEEANELITGGGFETAAQWTLTQLYTKPTSVGASARRSYPTTLDAYGRAYGRMRYEGNYMYCLVQNDIISQPIEFPAEGLYRLSYFGHTRIDNVTGQGLNPVKAFWVAEGSTVTNWIGTATPKTTNFVECVFTFKVPSATRAIFGLQGGMEPTDGNQGDHTTVLDGVSLKRVFSENGGMPDVPEGLVVRVAADAKLSLDYDGTLKLRALYLGGHAARGLISSETHPQYIEGVGEIYVKPRGAVFSLR
jgi:hypothetical protein